MYDIGIGNHYGYFNMHCADIVAVDVMNTKNHNEISLENSSENILKTSFVADTVTVYIIILQAQYEIINHTTQGGARCFALWRIVMSRVHVVFPL